MRRLHEMIEDALDYPGASSPEGAERARNLAETIGRVVDMLKVWAPLRSGQCIRCGEPVDAFNGVELRLIWATARRTRPSDGKKAGGRNNPGRVEKALGIWMCRRCSDEQQSGIHRDQRTLLDANR